MKEVLRIFLAAPPGIRWVVTAGLLLAGIAEGLGLTSLLPLVSIAIDGAAAAETSPINRVVFDLLAGLGLPSSLEVMIAILFVLILLRSILRFGAMRQVGYAAADVATNLRVTLIENLMQARWSYFASKPIGLIANAVSLEATRSARAFIFAAEFIAGMIQCVIYVLVALVVSWKVALVALVLGGTIAGALSFLVRTAKKAGRRQTKRTRQLVTQLSDALAGMKPIKAMSRQAHFRGLFDTKIAELRQSLKRQVLSRELMANLQEPLLVVLLVGGVYLASTRWSVPVPELVVIALVLLRLVGRINNVQRLLQRAAEVESAYWAIKGLVRESGEAREASPGSRQPTLTRGCSIRNVSYAYDHHPVLRDVSLDIPAGRITVITGASGAGKTTLIDLLLGLYLPREGEILIDQVPLDEIDLTRWRAMVGYVPQELFLFHDTILANVTLGDPSIGAERAREALAAAGAWDFVAALPEGLETVAGERGTKLSGGQRQRIALARALVHRPSLLILDEVTSALDPDSEREICDNIRRLAGELTVIAITHRPAWTEIADQVYELGSDAYRLVPEDSPAAAPL